MYTGGRISRLFSTVAGPFHPFGGAVDIIVVQQQDGSFKSTPWYVKFGKFQGVLKRSEAIVTVAVNGVDANFHLYLDNTGEAYFLKEIESFDEDEDYSPRSSDSSNDAMIIGNDSFKSVMSHEADGQHDDRYGDEDKESEKYSPVKGGSDICYKNNDMVVSVSDNGSFLESSTTEKCGCSGDASRNGGADSKHSENCWESRVEASMLIVDGSIGAFEMSSRKSQNGTLFLSGFNEYEYENLEFQQMENTESRKAENDNSEMILMTGDGHMMTAPISSFKNNMYLCNETQAGKSECSPADGNHVGQATDLGLEISGENNDMESKEETSRHSHSSDLDEVMSNDNSCSGSGSQPKEEDLSNMEEIMSNDNSCNGTKKQSTEDHPSNLEDTASNESSCSGTERRSKESTGNSFASPERNSKERNDDLQTRQLENCSEDSGHQMIRNESDLEFGFNDDEIYKSCANFSELYSPIDEEGEKHESLSPHPEEDEEEYGVTCNKEDNIESHDLSRFSSNKSSPMAVPRLRATARDAREISGSMPNMVLHFSHTEIPVNDGFCSRSFDSVYSPCQKTSDQATFADSKELNSSTRGSFLGSESSTPRHGISDSKVETSDKTDHTNLHNSIGRDITDEDVKHKMDIEISLCRDLLYKGMGREAAAHAFESRKVSKEEFKNSTATVMKNEKLVVKIKGRYFPWSEAAPLVLGLVAFDVELPAQHAGEILVDDPDSKAGNNRSSDSGATSGGGWRLWPFSFRRPRTPDTSISVSAQVNTERKVEENGDSSSRLKNSYKKQQKHKVRTNSPTSDQLASLNLKEGQNMITFTVLTSVWGKQQVDARIYLWKWNTKIVISDVDGTITKSDVLGQVMPWVGKDWSQTGVARFFSAIKDNGYQLLFLSARAIAQAYLTRQFLLNLKQDGKKLPDGPVVISPDGLFPSLYREVIRRAPHEFKISCLEDIRALFPPDVNPFYAGFGNRDTDEISYLKVGIPKGKIFIINPKGQVVVNNCVDVKSYTSLHNLADDMFPPPVSSCEQEDFNSWNYWKVPLPAIED